MAQFLKDKVQTATGAKSPVGVPTAAFQSAPGVTPQPPMTSARDAQLKKKQKLLHAMLGQKK